MKLLLSSIVFAATLVTGLFATMTTTISAQEDATDSEQPKFLAIQNAKSGTILEINATASSLELNDVSDKTILFSDRPDRIVMSISTLDFVGNWSVGEDSFAVDAPNAVLVVDELEKQDDVIVELFNPVYDSNTKTLKYEIFLLNATSTGLPREIGRSTIVIDNTQVGETISNIISQANTMKNMRVGGK